LPADWNWPAKSVLLMSRRRGRWKALAELTFEMSGDHGGRPPSL